MNSSDIGMPIWAVIDPSTAKARPWIDDLGTDAVELDSIILFGSENSDQPFFQIRTPSLSDDQLIRICRRVSLKSGGKLSERGAFFLAWEGHLLIDSSQVYVCSDPAEGRDHYARRQEEKEVEHA